MINTNSWKFSAFIAVLATVIIIIYGIFLVKNFTL